ncbi:MAG: tetratricopeptide repeat protein, partial [Geminicoccaceae bacterium]
MPARHALPVGRAFVLLLCSLAVLLGGMGPAPADQQDLRLNHLFARLQATSSQAEAQAAQQQIWQIWIESDDSSASRLMQRGIQAMATRQHALALEYFDRLVERAPDFAEGWNKRATVYYLLQDYEASVLDIERTLELEPRHFGALSGLGMIYDAIGEPAAALRSYEAAVAINPHLGGTRQRIEA